MSQHNRVHDVGCDNRNKEKLIKEQIRENSIFCKDCKYKDNNVFDKPCSLCFVIINHFKILTTTKVKHLRKN